MRLAGIHPGDIVRAEGTYWQVGSQDGRHLVCVHLHSRSQRRFSGHDVQEHWRHRVERGPGLYAVSETPGCEPGDGRGLRSTLPLFVLSSAAMTKGDHVMDSEKSDGHE